MLKLIAQRLGLGVLTLFAASVLIFIGTETASGRPRLRDPAEFRDAGKSRQAPARPRPRRPAIVRFLEWLFGALHGDFGHSLANGRDVLTEIAPRFANTMFLAAYAAFVAVPIAVGLGISRRSGREASSTG